MLLLISSGAKPPKYYNILVFLKLMRVQVSTITIKIAITSFIIIPKVWWGIPNGGNYCPLVPIVAS